ncbi:transporter family-2 protein [Peribacillus deserti]|uniref:Transporter family-2 protein n=1 Tax=Peribacillus deserti TaxID=673318 RepID=A0ABS2QL27_9BACI|nr:DMT family transporter [Peribacillus deserti]MBM7693879.1 transporter family-2 protein [Peribacillus deserti]
MRVLFPVLAFIGGIAIAFQAQINGGLGKKAGSIEAAFISFLIGTAALFFVTIFFGKGNMLAAGTVPKWQLLGGLLGAFYVFIMVVTVPKIGVASTFIAVIAGQMIIGAIIDHFGLMGGIKDPISTKKIAAFLLLFVSLYLFNKK